MLELIVVLLAVAGALMVLWLAKKIGFTIFPCG